MTTKRKGTTPEPIPKELIYSYLTLPYHFRKVRVDCYRYDDTPTAHWIHFSVTHEGRLWQYAIVYDQYEVECSRGDFLHFRWNAAIRDLKSILPNL